MTSNQQNPDAGKTITQLETDLRAVTAERDIYKKSFTEAVESCGFMQTDERTRTIFMIGERTTVEGVAALREDRDALLAERDKWRGVADRLAPCVAFALGWSENIELLQTRAMTAALLEYQEACK